MHTRPWIYLLAALVAACGAPPANETACGSLPLINGSAKPDAVSLSDAETRAVVALEGGSGAHLCTGTVVSPGWVLTAAHCAMEDTLLLRPSWAEATLTSVRITHSDLDAMLLAFEEPDRQCGCGPCEAHVPPWEGRLGIDWLRRTVVLAGAGVTEDGTVGELRFAVEPVVDMTRDELWVDGHGATGACGGDSGGPALARDAEGRLRVVGVLDRGAANCLGLDVYTRADVLSEWITEVIRLE